MTLFISHSDGAVETLEFTSQIIPFFIFHSVWMLPILCRWRSSDQNTVAREFQVFLLFGCSLHTNLFCTCPMHGPATATTKKKMMANLFLMMWECVVMIFTQGPVHWMHLIFLFFPLVVIRFMQWHSTVLLIHWPFREITVFGTNHEKVIQFLWLHHYYRVIWNYEWLWIVRYGVPNNLIFELNLKWSQVKMGKNVFVVSWFREPKLALACSQVIQRIRLFQIMKINLKSIFRIFGVYDWITKIILLHRWMQC